MTREQSIEILENLLNGVNPVTGEVLPGDHVCLEADVMRALHAAVTALRATEAAAPVFRSPQAASYPFRKNGKMNAGRPWTKDEQQQLVSLYRDHWSLDEICHIMQRRPRGVRNQLEELGFDTDDFGKSVSPTAKQPETKAAQRGKPWTHADHEWMTAAWKEGCTITEMADHLGRTPHAIRLRLEKYGLFEGGMTAEDEPPAWSDADNKECFRMVDEGCTVAQMAQRFGRTEKAMEARLFYLGLSKKAPKLF